MSSLVAQGCERHPRLSTVETAQRDTRTILTGNACMQGYVCRAGQLRFTAWLQELLHKSSSAMCVSRGKQNPKTLKKTSHLSAESLSSKTTTPPYIPFNTSTIRPQSHAVSGIHPSWRMLCGHPVHRVSSHVGASPHEYIFLCTRMLGSKAVPGQIRTPLGLQFMFLHSVRNRSGDR